VGVSTVHLEAIVQGGDWEPFFQQQLKREGESEDAHEGGSFAGGPAPPLRARELPRLRDITPRKALALLEPLLRSHAKQTEGRASFFSILTPTYNSEPRWLAEAALSLLHQSFEDWEWCVVDDGSPAPETRRFLESLNGISPRLRIKFQANAGICAATNEALELATGEFVCLLDHDDLLDSEALSEMAKKLRAGFDVVYSDEDKLEDASGKRVEPFFKPDWSPEYFRGAMYVGHLLCLRRDLARKVRFDSTFDGVQDFEFMLRVSETGAKIGHIPKLLYHWRKTPGSIAEKTDAKPEIGRLQARAVNAHLQRLGLRARGEPTDLPHRIRITPEPRTSYPRVSVVIPTKDAPELLGRCLESLYRKTSYPDFEVILVDNGTEDPEALRIMRQHPLRRLDLPGPFNFSRANNRGAQNASGSFLLFLNNDTEISTPDWLQHLLFYAEQPDVAAAGALLVYGDGSVQHAGVALGMRGTADHTMRGFPRNVDGYAGSLVCAREVSAVTAACMMIRKSLFEEIGGFNEHFFTAYQDLDLCLRLRERNLRVIYAPRAVVVHHESASRKTYYDMVDRMLLLDQWEELIERGDPYYNPNLNLERGDYSLASVS
jgi:GT2 family glycosyltransferase